MRATPCGWPARRGIGGLPAAASEACLARHRGPACRWHGLPLPPMGACLALALVSGNAYGVDPLRSACLNPST